MIRSRWQLWLVVVLAAVAVLIVPAVASAAPLAGSTQVDSPQPPIFSIPGVFSLTIGEGFTNTGEEVKLDTAEIQLDAINATATVNGLTLGPKFIPTGWGSIAVTQNAPLTGETYTVANGQVAVGGAASGYTTVISADLNLQPSEAVQINGTFGIGYDGLAGALGVGMRDASLSIQAGPVNIAASGVNTGQGEMAMDSLDATIAATGTNVKVTGLTYGPEGADWDTLDVTQPPLSIGNALTLTPFTLRVGGSETGYSTAAVVGLGVQAGEAVQLQGELVTVRDGTTGQMAVGFQNMNASLTLPSYGVAVQGLNTGPGGTSVDTVMMSIAPLGVTAEVNGMAMNEAGQFVFDDATIRYEAQGEAGMTGGFQMTVTRQDQGYILTTTTIVPTARK